MIEYHYAGGDGDAVVVDDAGFSRDLRLLRAMNRSDRLVSMFRLSMMANCMVAAERSVLFSKFAYNVCEEQRLSVLKVQGIRRDCFYKGC